MQLRELFSYSFAQSKAGSYYIGMEYTLDILNEQEKSLQFSQFTHADARALGELLVKKAESDKLAVTIDVRKGDQIVFHAAMEGTSADNDQWVERKNRVVRRFGHSSMFIGTKLKNSGLSLEEKYGISQSEYAPHGGCFPVIVRNVGPVGTVTVSGLSQEDDHTMVINAVSEFLAG